VSFRNIHGQDKAVELLSRNLKEKSFYSTYLFLGPDGVGKKLAAITFAKAINCVSSGEKPCTVCPSCRKIDSGNHPDVVLTEPKNRSNTIGINEIRKILQKAGLKAYEAGKKVFIIDGAHIMTPEAANAFLKTLEEAPRDTIFILIATSKELLLSTVVSRAVIIRFRSAPLGACEKVLSEKFNIDRKEARMLSVFSSGRIGRALEMREKGLIRKKNAALDALFGKNKPYSGSPKEDIEFLLSYLRDLFVYKATGRKDLVFNADRTDEIATLKDRYSFDRIDELIQKVVTLESYMDHNVNPKIVFDVIKNSLAELTPFNPGPKG